MAGSDDTVILLQCKLENNKYRETPAGQAHPAARWIRPNSCKRSLLTFINYITTKWIYKSQSIPSPRICSICRHTLNVILSSSWKTGPLWLLWEPFFPITRVYIYIYIYIYIYVRNERPSLEACCVRCKHRPNNGKVGERHMVSKTRRHQPLSSLSHKHE